MHRLILVDEGGKGQLSDIVEKLVIRHAQLAGATILAKKAGFRGSCLTPFVYEYRQLKDSGQIDESFFT